MKIRKCFDLTGCTFGKWKVLDRAEPPPHITGSLDRAFWLCECQCGVQSIVMGKNLRNGRSKSCGCGTLQCKTGLTCKDA
jgi:hypothetical protein